MDSWKAWAVFFISVCIMVVVLAYLDYEEAAIAAVAIPFGLGIFCALLGYLRRGREIRHQERMAMIEKGIYIEARNNHSGIPSLAMVLLVGIGLATVIASDVAFFGFALLFVGIGLIVRSRLMYNRKIEKGAVAAASGSTAGTAASASTTGTAGQSGTAGSAGTSVAAGTAVAAGSAGTDATPVQPESPPAAAEQTAAVKDESEKDEAERNRA